uniref:Uncharacterized protein n=1 Tax=Heterosigma akashiwo TaxID=2829 RepID=A0A7S3YLX7_HETAK
MTLHMVNSTQPVESRGEEVDTALTLLALGGGGDRQQERQQQSLRRDDTTGHVMQVEHTKPTVACTESSPMRVIHRSMSVDLSQTSYPRLAPVLYSHPYHPSGSHLETFEMTRSNPSPQYVPVIRSGRRRASIDSYQYHQDEALRRSSLGRFVSPRIAYVSDRDLDNFWHYDRNSTDQQYRTPPASLVLVTHERPTHLISHPAEIEAEQRQLHHYVPVPIPPPADVMLRHYDNEVDSHHQRMVFKQQYNHFHPSIESSPTVWHQAVRHDDTSESTAAAEREKKMTLPSSSDKRSGDAEAVKQKDRSRISPPCFCTWSSCNTLCFYYPFNSPALWNVLNASIYYMMIYDTVVNNNKQNNFCS